VKGEITAYLTMSNSPTSSVHDSLIPPLDPVISETSPENQSTAKNDIAQTNGQLSSSSKDSSAVSSTSSSARNPPGTMLNLDSVNTGNGNQARKRKGTFDSESDDDDGDSGTPSSGKKAKMSKKPYRFDNSLAALTDKFIKLVKESEFGVVDLNEAADRLHVQKRRIYDITNVLEGIGLVLKKNKNHIEWQATGFTTTEEVEELKEEIKEKMREEELLDYQLMQIQNHLKSLAEEPTNLNNAYVTVDDVCGLQSMQGESLLVLKAPSGTKLEVPDPDEGMPKGRRRYQIHLKSGGDPIDVFLLENSAVQSNNNWPATTNGGELPEGPENMPGNANDSLITPLTPPPMEDEDYYLRTLGLEEGISDMYGHEESSSFHVV